MRRIRHLARAFCRVQLFVLAVFMLAGVFSTVQAAWAGDPSGANTGKASDAMDGAGNTFIPSPPPTDTKDPTYAAKKQAYDEYAARAKYEPLAVQAADMAGQNRVAINIAWTLITGYLVMFMQAGFALVETGFCRGKNAAHVMMTNFMIYPIGMLGFWISGFAFMFGGMGSIGAPGSLGGVSPCNLPDWHGIIGTHGFFLKGNFYDVGVYALFLFQMVFMDTTATIPTGAMAERWKFSAFVLYGFYVSMVIYPIYGHWVWGGGWLAMLGATHGLGHGAVDFAGSGVVHSTGGFTALAGAIVLGPRIGKFIRGKPQPIPGHNLPMALLGTFILAFGWFGFNPGSTLGASGGMNLRISVIAVNTMLASASGAFITMCYWWWRYGKPDPSMCANGMLAGLVAITAPCAFVDSIGAVIIGAVAAVLVSLSVPLVEKAGVDDPVGAVSVHGTCGIWGVLSVGLFADGKYGIGWNTVGATSYMGVANRGVTGLFYGDASQLAAQAIDAVVVIAWSFAAAWIFFTLQKKLMGIRSAPQDEIEGLDLPEMGALGYTDRVPESEPEPVREPVGV